MSNKFLKQYPKLIKPKAGDKIKIVQVLKSRKKNIDIPLYYKIGDTGTILVIEIRTECVYHTQFDFENYSDYFSVYREEFEVIYE
jgi:hypothetical protein